MRNEVEGLASVRRPSLSVTDALGLSWGKEPVVVSSHVSYKSGPTVKVAIEWGVTGGSCHLQGAELLRI